MNVSDRILVLYEGEIVGEFAPRETTVEQLGLYMAGARPQPASGRVRKPGKSSNLPERTAFMMARIRKLIQKPGFDSLVASIAAIGIGLIFGLILLIVFNPEKSIYGFGQILFAGSVQLANFPRSSTRLHP